MNKITLINWHAIKVKQSLSMKILLKKLLLGKILPNQNLLLKYY